MARGTRGSPGNAAPIVIGRIALTVRAWAIPNARRGLLLKLAALLVIGGAAIGGSPLAVAAEEAPPPRPAHVHRGTCENLEPGPAYRLDDLTVAAEPSPTAARAAPTIPTAVSVTTIDVPLSDLLADAYVVNIHESAAEAAEYIACGTIAGEPGPNGLAVALAPHGPHGDFSGVAWLRPEDDRTVVAVFLTEGIMAARIALAATPTAAEPEEIAVTLGGPAGEFAITTEQTDFKVGVPYRFVVTNAGQVPHEFMVIPPISPDERQMEGMHHLALGEIGAEDLPPGATATLDLVFDEGAPAGALELACYVPGHYEAGMHLAIEVEG